MSFVTHWFYENNHLELFKHKIFIKVFQYILKSLETFYLETIYIVIAKNTNKQKNKTRDKL